MPEVPQAMLKSAAPKGVLRFIQLLKGGDMRKLYARGQAAHALSLFPGSKVTPEMVDRMYAPYRAEVQRVLGAYAGTGLAIAGAGAAVNRVREASQSPWQRTLSALGVKSAADDNAGIELAGGVAGAGLGAKLYSDLRAPIDDIRGAVAEARQLGLQPRTAVNDLKALNAYAAHGHKALNRTVFGLPLVSSGVSGGNPWFTGKYKDLAKSMWADRHALPLFPNYLGQEAAKFTNAVAENVGVAPSAGHSAPWFDALLQKMQGAGYRPGSATARSLAEIAAARHHYSVFKSGPSGSILKHLIDEAVTGLPQAQKNMLGQGVWDLVNGTAAPAGGASYVNSLLRAAPTAEGRKAVLQALRSAANTNMYGPGARVMNYATIARNTGKLGRGMGVLGMLLGTGTALYGLRNMQRQHTKLAQAVSGDDAIGAAAGLGGLGLGAAGIHTIRRPLDVGVTWGEAPDWGDGHKGPGNELHRILKERADTDGFRLTKAVRGSDRTVTPLQASRFQGQDSMRPVRGRKFDVLFDTGMGAGVPPRWAGLGGKPTPSSVWDALNRPTARMGGYVSYMTDVPPGKPVGFDSAGRGMYSRGTGALSMLRAKFTPSLLQDTVLSYGPPSLAQDNPTVINKRTSGLATPLIRQDAIDAIAGGGGKQGVIRDLLASPGVSDQSKALLRDLPASGKRVLVISGSGRGDQVALKALRTQQYLVRNGLTDKVQVVALLGNSPKYTPYAQLVNKVPGIISVGFVDNKLFTRLPMLGDLHWGSTGTSSLFESLASPVPFAQTRNANKWRDIEVRMVNKHGPELAARGMTAPQSGTLGHIDLDQWNRGNKMLAGMLPATHTIQTPRAAVKALLSAGPDEARQAASRGRGMLRALSDSKEQLRSGVIPAVLARAAKLKKVRGLGLIAGGLGLAGAGAGYAAHQRQAAATPQARLQALMQRLRGQFA